MASNQGITSLPRTMSLDESYGAMQQNMGKSNPQASQAVNQALDKLSPMLNKLDSKTLDLLLQLTQYLKDHKSKYKQLMAKLEEKGSFPPGVFPDNYDPKFLSVFALSVAHAKQARGMAAGGITDIAQHMKDQGRGKDTILAHINPKEAALLRDHGGMGTTNPSTGLPEFGLFDDLVKGIKGVGDFIGDVIRPVGNAIGDIIHSPLGLAATAAAGMYFFGMPTFGAEATIPSVALPEAVIPGAAPAAEGLLHLTPAALESGLGTPGYGVNASAAESGLFDPAKIGAGASSDFATNGMTAKDVLKKGKDLLSQDSQEQSQSDPNQLLKLLAMLEMMKKQNQPTETIPLLSASGSALPYDSPKNNFLNPSYAQKAADGGLMMNQRYDIGGLTADRAQTDYLAKMSDPSYRPGQGGITYFTPLEYKPLTVANVLPGQDPAEQAAAEELLNQTSKGGGSNRAMSDTGGINSLNSKSGLQSMTDLGLKAANSGIPGLTWLGDKMLSRAEEAKGNTGLARNTVQDPAQRQQAALQNMINQYSMYNNPNAVIQKAIENTDFSGMDRGSVSNAPSTPESQAVREAINRTDFSGMDRNSDNGRGESGTPSNSGESGGWGSRDAGGGGLAQGGITALGYNLGSYSDGGRLLQGPGDGVSDSIPATIGGKQPARLANGEFVIPARIVSELGNGSTDAGAKRLYEMMDRIQKVRRKTKNVAANTKAAKYLPA